MHWSMFTTKEADLGASKARIITQTRHYAYIQSSSKTCWTPLCWNWMRFQAVIQLAKAKGLKTINIIRD